MTLKINIIPVKTGANLPKSISSVEGMRWVLVFAGMNGV